MKKKLLALFTCFAMVFCLSACSSGTNYSIRSANTKTNSVTKPAVQSTPSTTAKKTPVTTSKPAATGPMVGISMPSRKLLRWSHDGAYLNRAFAKAGFQTILKFANDDPKQQINDIQDMISGGAKVIIVGAIDAGALDDVLKNAVNSKISVIAYDRLIKSEAAEYLVTFDNLMVGTMQGQYVADTLGLDKNAGPFNIEFTTGDMGDANSDFYFSGAYDVLKPYIDSGKVKIPSGQNTCEKVSTAGWDTETAKQRAAEIIKSKYSDGTKLDAWVCANDSTALGVAAAIAENYKGKNTVIVTGQDGEDGALKNIADGLQSMTVYKMQSNEAVVTFDLAKMLLNGLTPDESLITTGNWVFDVTYDTTSYENTPGHACTSYLLKPVVITADNMEEELLETGNFIKGDDGYLRAAG